MENTEELDIDIDDIGTILKSSRLKSKKTMEEISSELCIRKIYLTALEDGDYETLPPIPYGVGYVRTYAKFLGLNPERAVKLYKAASQTEEQNKENEEEIVSTPNRSGSLHILVGIIAIAMLYGIWKLYDTPQAPLVVDVQETSVAIEESASNVSDTLVDDEATDSKTETLSEEVASEASEDIVEEKSVTSEDAPKEIDNTVVLEFNGESWVELKDKNKVYFQGVFHKGERKEVKYADNLFLSVGRPKNVKIFVKGEEKNILVKKRKMNIPLDSLN